MDPFILEPAHSPNSGWTGSAAAESSMIVGSLDLYELAGLEQPRWAIMAVDMTAFSHGKQPKWDVRVYAFDNEASGVANHEDLQEYKAHQGALPVKEILLHDVDLETVVRSMKMVSFQLRLSGAESLLVVEDADFPDQP